MAKKWLVVLAFALSISIFRTEAFADDPVQKLFQRLTGVPLLPTDARYAQMKTLVDQGKMTDAAAIATGDAHFYSTTIQPWAASISNQKESPYEPLSDFEAMIIGVVRDDVDARQLLSGNFRYEADPQLGLNLPAVNRVDNNHYAQLQASGKPLMTALVKHTPQWDDGVDSAGLLTTRRFGSEFYSAGTNRRAWLYTAQEFLCTTKDKWRTVGLPDFHIRRDVTRAPSGVSDTFQTQCRSCHAPMDALAGAFAGEDFTPDQGLVIGGDWIAPKMNKNGTVYPQGYVTQDASWINLFILSSQDIFGWRGVGEGNGINSFGTYVANSTAFSSCMVQRVFARVCRQNLGSLDAATAESLRQTFETGGYHLKSLFIQAALLPQCDGGSQ